jgi:hypothetical protein
MIHSKMTGCSFALLVLCQPGCAAEGEAMRIAQGTTIEQAKLAFEKNKISQIEVARDVEVQQGIELAYFALDDNLYVCAAISAQTKSITSLSALFFPDKRSNKGDEVVKQLSWLELDPAGDYVLKFHASKRR